MNKNEQNTSLKNSCLYNKNFYAASLIKMLFKFLDEGKRKERNVCISTQFVSLEKEIKYSY